VHPAAVAQNGYRRVLVALVDNRESERALDVACSLTSEHHASLVAIAVVEISPLLPLDAHMTEEEGAARRLLERAAAVCDSYGIRMTPRLVRAREAGAAIVEEARAQETQVLVMGASHKPQPSGRALAFGATVELVLREAPCRVMLISETPEVAGGLGVAAA
jgi:nucleotide-binding universal stress UspA family protein